jgi:hypothetical protein
MSDELTPADLEYVKGIVEKDAYPRIMGEAVLNVLTADEEQRREKDSSFLELIARAKAAKEEGTGHLRRFSRMARPCTICVHEDSIQINEDLVLRRRSNRAVAGQYNVSRESIRRHKRHIPQLLVKARDRTDRGEAESLVDRLETITVETGAILREAREEASKDNELALRAIARLEKQLELEAKILEIIKTQPQVNVLVQPEFVQAQTKLLLTLDGFPEAKDAVVRALRGADNGSG